MFEKSLYDLIRGLRNHKGNEKEYIQDSLKECRVEIRSQDMDLKATALLKLIYLEMFGHDMSWASFHVLEVMSSQKYLQKRVGYLGAMQSFGPKTDVLMLATNLLKKDLTSSVQPTMALPLATIPHIITPSLALSLLPDLLPRLTHSHPAIRKKTIVTLYRLALVYPETLRAAWPKIKERLMDEHEDLTVTVALVNVVCELGWRRPQDFLSLAPRLFELLVDGGNNWMAIKIIKLFATLTPLEPRLVRKLLPPLTSIIQTTPAMSLLYECINGIIQGGILQSAEGTAEGEEIASLCVDKLRDMIVTDSDRNLKYVALLAIEKIVVSHPHLVSLHQDVITDCVDEADMSIRLRALDLVGGMVNRENLSSVVGRLMRQLRNAPTVAEAEDPAADRPIEVEPAADSDDEDPEENLRPAERVSDQPVPLPLDYRISVIHRILEMCARETYTNLNDFNWYIDILVQLTHLAPWQSSVCSGLSAEGSGSTQRDVSLAIGLELQNVAVRVKQVRTLATRAAEKLLLGISVGEATSALGGPRPGALGPTAWIVGEYAASLALPRDTLLSMLQSSVAALPAESLTIFLQAIPKVFVAATASAIARWDAEHRSMTTLLIARVVHFLEGLTSHPNLEVQERAVEFVELMRLASEAMSNPEGGVDSDEGQPPLILVHVIPSLFQGMELNPVAPGAQRKVPAPEGLDLDVPINPNLPSLLQVPDLDALMDEEFNEFQVFYKERPAEVSALEPAISRLNESKPPSPSYQQSGDTSSDAETAARRRAQRRERNKDDPFYIASEGDDSTAVSPLQNIIRASNGHELDIDAIPIMKLDIDGSNKGSLERSQGTGGQAVSAAPAFDITQDETISPTAGFGTEQNVEAGAGLGNQVAAASRNKRSILQVDSSSLGAFSIEGTEQAGMEEMKRTVEDEEEMARAMKEVERLRLEMQRASERIQLAQGVPREGTLVRKKKKKKKKEGGSSVETQSGAAPEHAGMSAASAAGDVEASTKSVEGADAKQMEEGEQQQTIVKPRKIVKKKKKILGKEKDANAEPGSEPRDDEDLSRGEKDI